LQQYLMTMSSSGTQQARFDARLSIEQKLLLERAASLGGYRNLTDFVFSAAKEKAKEIIREQEEVLASERDAELFFNAITQPLKPSENLKQAVEYYNTFISESE
jgi:uncharacterized protein (DUF1778 family)